LASAPLMTTRSLCKFSLNSTVVFVSSAARVIEIEPFAGNRRDESIFPQYLINAILGCAMADLGSRFILNHSTLKVFAGQSTMIMSYVHSAMCDQNFGKNEKLDEFNAQNTPLHIFIMITSQGILLIVETAHN